MEGQALVFVTTKNHKASEKYFENWDCPDNKAIKDPEKQANWKREKRQKEIEDNRLAATNRVVGFALVNINDHEDFVVKVGDEREVLTALTGWIGNKESDVWLKGARNYSVPFLVKRFIASGVRMPRLMAPLRIDFSQHKLYDTNDILGTYSQSCEETTTSIDEDFFLVTGEFCKSNTDVRLCCDMMEKGDVTATEELKSHLKSQARKLAVYVKRATDLVGV